MLHVRNLLARLVRIEQRVRPDLSHLQAEHDALIAKVRAAVDAYELEYPLSCEEAERERQAVPVDLRPFLPVLPLDQRSLIERYARSLGITLADLKQRLRERRQLSGNERK